MRLGDSQDDSDATGSPLLGINACTQESKTLAHSENIKHIGMVHFRRMPWEMVMCGGTLTLPFAREHNILSSSLALTIQLLPYIQCAFLRRSPRLARPELLHTCPSRTIICPLCID